MGTRNMGVDERTAYVLASSSHLSEFARSLAAGRCPAPIGDYSEVPLDQPRDMSARGLRAALTVLGVVALMFGSLSVVMGAAIVPGSDEAAASVDSELRFYAAWYAAAGVVLLRTARRAETEGSTIRFIAGVFFIAGCARVMSLIVVGKPHLLFVFLMAAELLIPALVVPWQASVVRRSHRRVNESESGEAT